MIVLSVYCWQTFKYGLLSLRRVLFTWIYFYCDLLMYIFCWHTMSYLLSTRCSEPVFPVSVYPVSPCIRLFVKDPTRYINGCTSIMRARCEYCLSVVSNALFPNERSHMIYVHCEKPTNNTNNIGACGKGYTFTINIICIQLCRL